MRSFLNSDDPLDIQMKELTEGGCMDWKDPTTLHRGALLCVIHSQTHKVFLEATKSSNYFL